MADYEDLIPVATAPRDYEDLIPKAATDYEDLIPKGRDTPSLQPMLEVTGGPMPPEPGPGRIPLSTPGQLPGIQPVTREESDASKQAFDARMAEFQQKDQRLTAIREQANELGDFGTVAAADKAAKELAKDYGVTRIGDKLQIERKTGETLPGKIGAAAYNVGAGLLEGLADPNTQALMAIGGAGPEGAAAIKTLFGVTSAAQVPVAGYQALKAATEGDVQGTLEGIGGVLLNTAFAKTLLSETPLDRIAKEVEASPTPISAGTVAAMREASLVTEPNPPMNRIFETFPRSPESPAIEEVSNAIQEQGPNAGVLRPEQPQVGLPQVVEGNAPPEVPAGGTGEVQAPEAPVGKAAAPVETTPEAKLSESLDKFPEKSPTVEAVKEHIEEQKSESLGITPTPPAIPRGTPLLEVAKNVLKEQTGIRKFTPYRETLNKWVGAIQESDLKTRELADKIESRVPSERKRAAITNWIQADGDPTVLSDRARATRNRSLQRGYVEAMHLTPDEVSIANDLKTYYANKAVELQNAGILRNVVDNYVTQIWDRGVGTGTAAQFAGKLAKNFKFSRQRTFPTFFEGEQAGYKPATKDISKLISVYSAEADKVLATRQMIADLTQKTAEDGRPLAVPSSIVKLDAESDPGTQLVFPNLTGKDFSDYVRVNHPALSSWKWGATDPVTGAKTMVLGELKVHPEIATSMRRALDRSWLRKWYDEPSSAGMRLIKGGIRALDVGGSEMKRTMLGFFSPFHIVQEGTHAIGHRVNPFFGLPEIKAGDPGIQDAMNHGLMLASDHTSSVQFKEGIVGPGLIKKIPGIGQWAEDFSNWTFQSYIPKLKYATYEKMVERNTKVFAKEIARGEVTPADVKALSAEQANAAYGHLNYADLGRDPTWQHILRTFLLAPDFLEARGRFTAQALKGLASKTGREQLMALGTLAATFWITARIGNKLTDDDWHFDHPFELKAGNRWLSMRSVPEDLFKLFKDTRKFVSGRLSPLFGQTGLELLTGRNYRGEKIETPQILEEALTRWIPITLRDIPGLRDLTETGRNNPVSPWESMLGTMGMHVSRYSPITETYKLAKDWNDKHGYKPDTGVYPISKYQQLRYALEDNDGDKARAEITKLHNQGLSTDKIRSGFKESTLHPFTKSKATDEVFRQSLTGDDRKTYDEAVRSRQRMVQKLDAILR